MSIELEDKLVTLESLGAVYNSEVNDRNAAIAAEATARTEAIANEVTARNAAIVEAINQAETGAPTKVELVSQMTDPNKNYLYIGEEQGYNSGHIYYLVDGAPVDKGVFGGTNIDNTLTISGQAADAKVTGDKIEEIKEDLNDISDDYGGTQVDVQIDISDILVGKRPNVDKVGARITSWVDTNYSTSIPNAFVCKKDKTYTLLIQNGNPVSLAGDRYILVTDDNYNIIYKQTYSVTSNPTDTVEFSPSVSGNVLITLDYNYTSVTAKVTIPFSKTAVDLPARSDIEALQSIANKLDNDVETLKQKTDVAIDYNYDDVSIDLTALDYITEYIGASRKWEVQGQATAIVLSATDLVGFTATAGSEDMFYAFLASDKHGVGQTPDYSMGYNGFLSLGAGKTETVTLPSDCDYLYIYRTKVGGASALPSSFMAVRATPVEEKAVNAVVSGLIHPLKGVTFSVMGDSISAFNGHTEYSHYYPSGNVNTYEKMYWGQLEQKYKMIIDTINADAGSCVGNQWIHQNEKIPATAEERLTGLGNPNVIIIQSGTNDYGGNPLGEYDLSGSYTDLNQFKVSYAYLLYRLKQIYPSAKIVCCTLMSRNDRSVENVFPIKQLKIYQDGGTVDKTTHYMYEFNESIRENAKRYDCAVCELSDIINYYNLANETVDGHCHPNAYTHAKMATRIAETLKSIM